MTLERINQDKIDRTNYLQTIDELEREAYKVIYLETNNFMREAITQQVEHAEEITDPQITLYYAPFLQASTRMFGQAMLAHQHNSMANVQHIANQYRKRRHVL